jgi:hypothetical protein
VPPAPNPATARILGHVTLSGTNTITKGNVNSLVFFNRAFLFLHYPCRLRRDGNNYKAVYRENMQTIADKGLLARLQKIF